MIDITQYLPSAPAPQWTLESAWTFACKLYPHRDNPAAFEALEVCLQFCMNHEDGTATANQYGDVESLYFDVEGRAA